MEAPVIAQSPFLKPVAEVVELGSEAEEWPTGNKKDVGGEPPSRPGQGRARSTSSFLSPCDIVSDQWQTKSVSEKPLWESRQESGFSKRKASGEGPGLQRKGGLKVWPGILE